MKTSFALAAAVALASCGHAPNLAMAPSPAEISAGRNADGLRILPDVDQPGQPDERALAWGALGNTELYAGKDPRPEDVIQGSLIGDCTYLAPLSVMARNNPKRLRDRTHLVGVTQAGAKVYKIHLYNAEGQMQMVYIDDQVLLSEYGEHPNDVTPIDPVSGKYITWAILWQKAAAKIWRDYDFMPHNERQSMFTLTGHKVIYAPLYNANDDTKTYANAILDRVDSKHITTADSAISYDWMNRWKGGMGLTPGSAVDAGQYVTATVDGHQYQIVRLHEYAVMSTTPATVTLRNPWGAQPGGTDGGYWTLPRNVFMTLFSGINMEIVP